MESPSYPNYVDSALRAIRSTLHLRWNNHAYVVAPGGIDAQGEVIPPKYAERFEVWDTDVEGAEYMVMMLRHQDGSYREPGQWLVDTIAMHDPARYDGDPMKMLEAVDLNNEKLRSLHDADYEALAEAMSRDWATYISRMAIPSAGLPN